MSCDVETAIHLMLWAMRVNAKNDFFQLSVRKLARGAVETRRRSGVACGKCE
jgi:hypothetical protein